ncbi:unnamed protein product [[Candida] boidinii]|uniref:Unnamed protein product n=1 Tax=Candida boidinii TaxID=5477 RepID=A0ACB5TQK3_CANBO|nr:unnamed protein product [[Candida] boidinii]
MKAIPGISSEKDKVNKISNMDCKDTPESRASNENYEADDEGVRGSRNRDKRSIRKRGSDETDFEDIKTSKKPTVPKKTSTRYITEQNPSSWGLERKHCVKCSISCDPLCESQSTYSYEDKLLRLLDSVIEDALNGAKMKYINTALNIPVYRVNINKSRLNKADTEKLQTWEAIHRNDNVIVRSNLINSGNENNNFKPPEDDLEYYYICFYVKNTLADINLAENDTFSDVTEECENCRKKNFRVCLVLNKELLFFKN